MELKHHFDRTAVINVLQSGGKALEMSNVSLSSHPGGGGALGLPFTGRPPTANPFGRRVRSEIWRIRLDKCAVTLKLRYCVILQLCWETFWVPAWGLWKGSMQLEPDSRWWRVVFAGVQTPPKTSSTLWHAVNIESYLKTARGAFQHLKSTFFGTNPWLSYYFAAFPCGWLGFTDF